MALWRDATAGVLGPGQGDYDPYGDLSSLVRQIAPGIGSAAQASLQPQLSRPDDSFAAYMADPLARTDADIQQRAAAGPPSAGQSLSDLGNMVLPYLAGAAPGGSLSSGIRAYHGSPYDFNAFDASKIGTGEGAQAFGHGLYFAEHEPVAASYRPVRRPNNAELDALARDHFGSGVDLAALQDAWSASKTAGTDAEAASLMYMRNSALRPLAEGDPLRGGSPNLEAFAKRLREMPPPGKMYEVDINAEPSQFLDWDKPTAEQPGMAERIQRGGQYQPAGEFLRRAYNNPFYGGDLTFRDQAMPAEVSAYLSSQGIPGIRYLDQGSRGVGQGTRNYVVFDPEKTPIDILRKYAVPGLISGGAAAGATSTGNP